MRNCQQQLVAIKMYLLHTQKNLITCLIALENIPSLKICK
jgi:hypothetical protein